MLILNNNIIKASPLGNNKKIKMMFNGKEIFLSNYFQQELVGCPDIIYVIDSSGYDPGYALLWPCPADCTKYYIYNHEEDMDAWILHSCPVSLNYNTMLQLCDYSENVDCEKNAAMGYPPQFI